MQQNINRLNDKLFKWQILCNGDEYKKNDRQQNEKYQVDEQKGALYS